MQKVTKRFAADLRDSLLLHIHLLFACICQSLNMFVCLTCVCVCVYIQFIYRERERDAASEKMGNKEPGTEGSANYAVILGGGVSN